MALTSWLNVNLGNLELNVSVSVQPSMFGDKSTNKLKGIRTRSPPESPPWSPRALSLHHYWTGSSWWESRVCHTPSTPDLLPLLLQAPQLLHVQPPEAGAGALWRRRPRRRSRSAESTAGGALECVSTGASVARLENSSWPGSGWWTGKAASASSVQPGPKFQYKERSFLFWSPSLD